MNIEKEYPPVCFILGAAEQNAPVDMPPLRPCDLLICADGGYAAACRMGLVPDLVIGDFDSLGEPPEGGESEVICLPVEKDVTDTEAALLEAERRGYRTVVLLGCTGGRPDHTYAAEQLVVGAAARGTRVFLLGEGFAAFAVCCETASFSAAARGTVSVFAVSAPAEGVTLTGLKYPLDGATLLPTVPLGVSNSFLSRAASVSVQSGALLVFTEISALSELSFS